MKKFFNNIRFFLIWAINSITSLRLSTEFRPYAVAIICFLWLVGLHLFMEGSF